VSAISRTVASVTLPEASSFAWRPRAVARHGVAHVVEREFVEHDDVGAGGQRLVELASVSTSTSTGMPGEFAAPRRWRGRWSPRR
jgi:hypothetical protein